MQNAKVKLRKFVPSDLEKVMETEKASFPEPWLKSYLKKLYEKHPDDFIVAEISNKVVGYILGYRKLDETGSIKTIAVNPSYRRKGVGKELVNFTLNKLRSKGVKEVFLHTRTKNKAASLFYKNLGFKILKTIKNYYRNGDDAYLMKKGFNMKKFLIYGFKPFKKYKKNISEEVIKRLNKREYIKIVLPIVYKKKYILNKIKKYKPDVIIGLGQSKGKIIKIERKAKNIFKKKIIKNVPDQYFVNLKLKKIPGTRISYNAGKYLCNFTMYVIMDFIEKKGLKTKFAFIHISRNYKIKKAVKNIEKLISQIKT